VVHIASSPWPAFITNEAMAVVAANHVAQEVWSIDLEREFRTPVERHLLNVMTQPRFADRIVNFDESARLLASMVKGSFGEAAAAPGGPAPYLAAVMEHMMTGDLKYLQRFLMIWADAPARIHKWRFTYPITWTHPTAGTMRFRCMVNPVNRADYLAINDWIPLEVDAPNFLGDMIGGHHGHRFVGDKGGPRRAGDVDHRFVHAEFGSRQFVGRRGAVGSEAGIGEDEITVVPLNPHRIQQRGEQLSRWIPPIYLVGLDGVRRNKRTRREGLSRQAR
jgi:hypothetical protein